MSTYTLDQLAPQRLRYQSGQATLNFGSGEDTATVTVTGQAGITSTSIVVLSLAAVASGANTAADAHAAAPILGLSVGNIIDNTSFDITGTVLGDVLFSTFKVNWNRS